MTEKNLPALSSSPALVPHEHEMMVFHTMAENAVNSKMYRGVGDKHAVMTIMLAAREIGIPPMAALNGGMHIINGQVEIAANMMSALIRKCGHSIQEKSSTDLECTLIGRRSDNGDTLTVTFSIEEARRAGLIKDAGGWKKWPKDMCYARCLSRLARRLFSDVIGVGYVSGETSGIYNASNEPHEASNAVLEEVPVDIIESEDSTVEQLLKNFLSQFDKDEAMYWVEYISQLNTKMNISLQTIIDKYNEDPEKAREKFNLWLEKQKT